MTEKSEGGHGACRRVRQKERYCSTERSIGRWRVERRASTCRLSDAIVVEGTDEGTSNNGTEMG